jgi:hypothetical protein
LPISEERKSLFARRDLVNKLLDIALSKSISLYSLVNSIFETYIEIVESGIDLEKSIRDHQLLSRAKSMGFILVPENSWHILLELTSNSLSTLSEEWRELGVWIAKYFSEKSTENSIADFSWFLEYMGAGEVIIREINGILEFKIAGLKLRKPYIDLIVKLVEGFLTGLNYSIISEDIIEEVIIIRAKKRD